MNQRHDGDRPDERHVLVVPGASPLADAVLQETRLRMLAVLASPQCAARGGLTLQELGEALSCTPQNVHHHVKVLEKAGVARVVRTEATQRIPRQFWVSDVRLIRLRMEPGVDLGVEVALFPDLGALVTKTVSSWVDDHGHANLSPLIHAFCTYLLSLEEQAARDLVHRLSHLSTETAGT